MRIIDLLKANIHNMVLFTVVTSVIFCLAGCGENQGGIIEANDQGGDSQGGATMQTTIIGGRTGGAWSVFTEGVAESIRRENQGSVITVEPGGIVENPPTVGTGKIPFGLSYTMTVYAAYKGKEPYDRPFEDIRAVSVIIPANYYQFIVRADMEYDSMDEIIKNQAPIRLAVDQKGSAGEIITRNILQSYGVTYKDILSWGGSVDHLGGSKTFELMADKRINATGDAVSVPSSDILEAPTTMELKLLSLNQETIKTVSKNLGMEPGTIVAGSYEFLKEDISTINTPAILLVNKNVPDEVVYKVTKAIYENIDYLGTVHEEFKNLTDKNIIDVGHVPLHSGAEKFFKEKGLID